MTVHDRPVGKSFRDTTAQVVTRVPVIELVLLAVGLVVQVGGMSDLSAAFTVWIPAAAVVVSVLLDSFSSARPLFPVVVAVLGVLLCLPVWLDTATPSPNIGGPILMLLGLPLILSAVCTLLRRATGDALRT